MKADVSPKRPDRSVVAAAAELRRQDERERAAAPPPVEAQASQTKSSYEDYTRRKEFRRMVDLGILQTNPREVSLESLQTLLKLAENIINNPGEARYQRFKPTNVTIKQKLVDPKGTLQYAVGIGFRAEDVDSQLFYVWHQRYAKDLCIGAAIIREALEREKTKEEEVARKRAKEKAADEDAVAKVKWDIYCDRDQRAIADNEERMMRAAREVQQSASELLEPSTGGNPAGRGGGCAMPGAGPMLPGKVIPAKRRASEREDEDENGADDAE